MHMREMIGIVDTRPRLDENLAAGAAIVGVIALIVGAATKVAYRYRIHLGMKDNEAKPSLGKYMVSPKAARVKAHMLSHLVDGFKMQLKIAVAQTMYQKVPVESMVLQFKSDVAAEISQIQGSIGDWMTVPEDQAAKLMAEVVTEFEATYRQELVKADLGKLSPVAKALVRAIAQIKPA